MIEFIAGILGPAFMRLEAYEKLRKTKKHLRYCERTLVYSDKEIENLKARRHYLIKEIAETKMKLYGMTAKKEVVQEVQYNMIQNH